MFNQVHFKFNHMVATFCTVQTVQDAKVYRLKYYFLERYFFEMLLETGKIFFLNVYISLLSNQVTVFKAQYFNL